MRTLALSSLALLLATAAHAADPPRTTDKDAAFDQQKQATTSRHVRSVAEDIDANWARPSADETAVTTAHEVTASGRLMRYKATAGTVTIRNEEGKPTASVFYTAYVMDGVRPGSKRPITFFYNGGPGSPSFWLHMGSFAPMRVTTANPEFIRPAPYGFGPNNDTLLDKTDMVFIDAVGTGYSRPLGDAKNADFWGVDQDADAFAKAIMRYVTINGRWSSPKFLFGESYGTTRSGALAYQLQQRGMALNGVILLSSVMNYGARSAGLDQVYIGYLPSYAATAWYHNKVPNRPADVATFVAEARAFAVGPYASALAKGDAISPQEADQVARQMSRFTGLSPEFIRRANLRVDLSRFRKELLRDQRLTIGRFDSRYTGVDVDAAGEAPEFDASDVAISGAFIASFNDYVTHTLNYKTDMPFRLSASEVPGFKWDWEHKAPGSRYPQNSPDVALDLSAAMRTNPYLKVLSMNGYFDMATPFFETEYDLSHMMLEPDAAKNVEFRYYPAGHMAYLNPVALHQMHADLARFYDETVDAAASGQLNQRPGISNSQPGAGPTGQ